MQAAPSRREETPKKGIGDSKAIAHTQYAAAPQRLQEFFALASKKSQVIAKALVNQCSLLGCGSRMRL
jgi:hypothetical protein